MIQNTRQRPSTAFRHEIARLISIAQGGEADYYAGKRGTKRVAEGLQLEMTASDPSAGGPCSAVSMHNISEGGFAFWSRRKLEKRTSLFVREFSKDNSRPWLPAHVTHCTVGIRGFLIGAAFDLP